MGVYRGLFYGDEFGGIERKIFLCCGMPAV
jgi:hypothetical protein